MADPFSIAVGSIALAEICVRLVCNLRHLQRSSENSGDEIENIVREVDSLKEICAAIRTTFGAKSTDSSPASSPVHRGPAEDLQRHLENTLNNCHAVAAKLDGIVQRICGHEISVDSESPIPSPGKLSTIGMTIRKRLRDSELLGCRAQMARCQGVLQLLLNSITMQEISNSHDYNARSFGSLSHDLQALDQSIQSQLADLHRSIKSADSSHNDAAALIALRELRDSVDTAAAAVKSMFSNRHFDIPQSVSNIFTGRETLLQDLRKIFKPRHGKTREQYQRRFIIHGLGGSGKTQFCCKSAQDNRDSFWGVFWIDASTQDRVKQTLGEIAERAGLEKNDNAALHWLSNLQQRWLLIIDNADGVNVPLDKYFPKGDRGNILVTSRNPAYKVYGNVGPRFYSFSGLEVTEATQLLLKASGQPEPWDSSCEKLASAITEGLGNLVLAIVHAGAAIRNKLCGLKDYLLYFRRMWDRIRKAKTKTGRGITVTDSDATFDYTTCATWEICYDILEQKRTEAASDALQLLNTLAFFHWETISPQIFMRALRNADLEREQEKQEALQAQAPSQTSMPNQTPSRLHGASAVLLTFILKNRTPAVLPTVIRDGREPDGADDAEDRICSALNELAKVSLVIHNDHNDTYTMHPIVHMWARERPRMRPADQALWADVAGRVLAASILIPPLGIGADDEKFQLGLISHVRYVQKLRAETAGQLTKAGTPGVLRKAISDWLSWLFPALGIDVDRMRMYVKFSLIYSKCGEWERAEALLKEVKETLDHYLGPQHTRSRQVTLFLSKVYWNMGDAIKAAELQTSVRDICKTHLGPTHLDTLRAASELGRTRWQQGQYTAAKILQEEVLRELMAQLPPDHEDILEAMDNLGLTMHKFWREKHMEEAHDLHSRAVEGMSRVHGPDHQRTLEAKENLCRVSVLLGGRHMGNSPGLMAEVLETRRRTLGREHPYTLLAMVNMAIVHAATGRLAEAEALVLRGLPVAERNLGRDHIGTLFGQHTLACVLVLQGKPAEAEAILVEVEAQQRRMASRRGDHHPDRLAALIELARCCFLQGKVGEAVAYCEQAIGGFDVIAPAGHPLADGLRTAKERICDGNHGRGEVHFPSILFRVCEEAG